MAVHGYVLIEAEVGRARAISEGISKLSNPDARIVAVDTVTGPYDVIVQLEAEDLDRLGRCITDVLQRVEGVERTTTCLAVRS
ncbi:MAG: Lrp/AsnC ligand binding domain-containing protein [Dehalococcoidia bacterium]|jgi:DNA-binding Lrp family transcriptional regulator|nr:Lrp/AsnC ligand binding domain-containing protein [Dehalococcoidia bacterium]